MTIPRKILLATGIWPPAVGGPASHAPELGEFLVCRGHAVRAVTVGGDDVIRPSFALGVSSNDGPAPVRMTRAARALGSAARRADVVYATGLYHRATGVSRLLGRPVVVKLVNDPAYERARGLGLFEGTLEAFQGDRFKDPRVRLLVRARNAVVASVDRVTVPSRYLAKIIDAWGVAKRPAEVIPNPAPLPPPLPDRVELRHRLGFDGPTFVFAGRVVPQKNLPLAMQALARVADARMVVVGNGPSLAEAIDVARREGVSDRVRFEPPVARDDVFAWLVAADAAILPSSWENHPHAALEAVATGTPMVATDVGGTAEILEHGRTGLLVAPGDVDGFAAAMEAVLDLDPPGVNGPVRSLPTAEQTFARIESILLEEARA